MPFDYVLDAVECPAIQVPGSFLSPTSDQPARAERLVSGAVTVLSSRFNTNAVHLDNLGTAGGCLAHAILLGGDLSDGGGLTLAVGATVASISAVPTVAAAQEVALADDSLCYIWMLRNGAISVRLATLTPPGEPAVFLGRVETSGGNIAGIDGSGRVEARGGVLYTRTGDTDVPGVSHPAQVTVIHRTDAGIYLWAGGGWTGIPDKDSSNTWGGTQIFGNVEVGGILEHTGTTAGFFNAAPVAQPPAPTAPHMGTVNSGDATTDDVIENIRTRVGEIESALRDLGLLQ